MCDSEAKAPENGSPSADAEAGKEFVVGAITRRWKREELLQKGSLVLRALGLFFSLLAFIIMASNKHGDWKNFDRYEEYRYLLGISILSTLYNGGQVLRHGHEFYTGRLSLELRTSAMVDFFGDQGIFGKGGEGSFISLEGKALIPYTRYRFYHISRDKTISYLLISSASTAVPLTNRMRESTDNIFTDTSAAAISMAFFAFFLLALTALISGYKLSTQSYI